MSRDLTIDHRSSKLASNRKRARRRRPSSLEGDQEQTVNTVCLSGFLMEAVCRQVLCGAPHLTTSLPALYLHLQCVNRKYAHSRIQALSIMALSPFSVRS